MLNTQETIQSLQQQAKILAGYRAALIAEGMKPEEALAVVLNYQTTQIQLNFMANNPALTGGTTNE